MAISRRSGNTRQTVTNIWRKNSPTTRQRITNIWRKNGTARELLFTTTPPAFAAPTNFQVASRTTNSMALSWNVVTDATGYRIRWKRSSDSTYSTSNLVTVFGGGSTSRTISGLTTNTFYDFQIQAYNADQESVWEQSTIFSQSTYPGVPSSFRVTSDTQTTVNLAWNAVTGASVYDLQYKLSTSSTWIDVFNIDGTTTTVSNLEAGTTYNFRIRAFANIAVSYTHLTLPTICSV